MPPGGGGCVRSAGGRAAVCGAPAGRVPVFWGVFIIAVHRAFVLGLGAQHRGIVKLSEWLEMCDSVRLLYLLTYLARRKTIVAPIIVFLGVYVSDPRLMTT